MFYRAKVGLRNLTQISISLLRLARNPSGFRHNDLPTLYNKKIMILGNGPSLKEVLETKKEKLKKYDLFAVNKFCLSDAYCEVQPKQYVIVDPDFFMHSSDESIRVMQKEVQKRFEEETSWQMNLFLPRNRISKEYAKKLKDANLNIKVYFFNTLTIEGPEFFRNRLYAMGVGMPFVGNVLISATMLAINMGYEEIELYGAEHSIHTQAYINDKNQVALEYKYFDGSSAEFIFWDNYDASKPQQYHEYLTLWRDVFKAYHDIESYAKYKHSNIFNKTKNSYIDAFKRIW